MPNSLHHDSGLLPAVERISAAGLNRSLFSGRSPSPARAPPPAHSVTSRPRHSSRGGSRLAGHRGVKKAAGAGSSTPRSHGVRAARRGVGPRGRMRTHPRRGGSTRDAGQGPAQLGSSQRLRSCRRICSETGQTSPPALPACHPRARSCAATLAAGRGPSSLDGPGCPFIRRFIRSLRGPPMGGPAPKRGVIPDRPARRGDRSTFIIKPGPRDATVFLEISEISV